MQLRSLAITRRPVWFDVPGERLDTLVIRATTRFWPAARGAALLLFDFADEVDATALADHRITRSDHGCYVYLSGGDGEFTQEVSLPNARLKRIGLQLWGAPAPFVLENIEIETAGGCIMNAHGVEDGLVVSDLSRFERLADSPGVLGLNLMTSHEGCTGRCHAISQHWYFTMDEVARRYPDENAGRTNCLLDAGAAMPVPITVFHERPAMLRVPRELGTYLGEIGDKSRNMIRKAQRLGYVYRKVDPDEYLDDVLAIRTSDPMRQGKPIPQYFKVRPTSMVDEAFRNSCQFHGEEFYGVFKDEVLVAYTTIFFYGELGQVNHILGHRDHLNEGVMNLLISEMIGAVIQERPWVRAINYLYAGNSRSNSGLGLFKRSTGFNSEAVVTTQSEFDLYGYFAGLARQEAPAAIHVPSARKLLKAGTSKALKEAKTSEMFIRPARLKDRSAAVEFALRALGENGERLKARVYRAQEEEVSQAHFHEPAIHALVFDNIEFENYQDFLSLKLKGFRKIVPKDSFMLFDFKLVPDGSYVMKDDRIARLIPRALQPKGRRVNQALTEYLSKRFKSLDMSVDDVKLGFKGSDYVVAGLIDYEHEPSYRNFDSLLILRKIR